MSDVAGGSGVLLAMDTSCDVCSIAVLRHGRLASEHIFRHGMHLSEHLTEHLDGVLREAECTLTDVEALAVGVGPGSFTGTRIGVMTMKTLAVVQSLPIYAVDGLQAMAAEYEGVDEIIAPILPCRADIVFAAAYSVGDSTRSVEIAPAALGIAELTDTLAAQASQGVLFCGEAVERYAAILTDNLAGSRVVSFGRVRNPRASMIAQIAWQLRLGQHSGEDPMSLVPLYISPPPITMPKTGVRLTNPDLL